MRTWSGAGLAWSGKPRSRCGCWPKAASDLLVSSDAELVKDCGDPTCRWLFLDVSKNHNPALVRHEDLRQPHEGAKTPRPCPGKRRLNGCRVVFSWKVVASRSRRPVARAKRLRRPSGNRCKLDTLTMHSIRSATAADIPLILELIRALATYEREPDAVKTTEADLLRDGFGDHPRFECLIGRKRPGQSCRVCALFLQLLHLAGTLRHPPGDLFVLPNSVGMALAKRSWQGSRRGPWSKAASGCNGTLLEWNQTPSTFTRVWARSFSTSGGLCG